MKKTILLVAAILFFSAMYAQETEFKSDSDYLSKNDVTISDTGTALFNNKTISMKNGEGSFVDVKFLGGLPKEVYESVNIDVLNVMLMKANAEAMYSMKNRFTYIPRESSLLYNKDQNEFLIKMIYTAQNDYGAMKDGTIFFTFDDKGNLLDKLNL